MPVLLFKRLNGTHGFHKFVRGGPPRKEEVFNNCDVYDQRFLSRVTEFVVALKRIRPKWIFCPVTVAIAHLLILKFCRN